MAGLSLNYALDDNTNLIQHGKFTRVLHKTHMETDNNYYIEL